MQSGLNIWMSRIFLALNISVVYPCISNNWQVCKSGLLKGYQSMTMDYCSELKRVFKCTATVAVLYFLIRKEVNVDFVNEHFISLLMPSPLRTPSFPQNNLLTTNPLFLSKNKKYLFLHAFVCILYPHTFLHE